jgi:tetratricopeptide (TPR) repeat protein
MAEGEFALMEHHLHQALKIGEVRGRAATGDHDVHAMLVDAAALRRDPAALREYAPRAEETATQTDHRLYMGIADRAWGVLHTMAGDFAEAEARLKRALDSFNSYPAPWQMGRTLFDMGELAKSQGEIEQARDYYAQALGAFEGLRAVPYVERTRVALEALGG